MEHLTSEVYGDQKAVSAKRELLRKCKSYQCQGLL